MASSLAVASFCSTMRATSSTWASSGRPASGCSTLGSSERMRLPTPAASTITSSGITRILGQYPVDLRGEEGPPLPPTASQAQIVIRLQIRHLDYSISHLDYSIQLPGLRDAATQGTCCNAALLFLRDLLKKLQHRALKRRVSMANRASNYWKVIGVAGALAGLVAWPGTGQAQLSSSTLTGQASVATASVLGNATSLVGTGTLHEPSEPLGARPPLGGLPGLLTAQGLHPVTIG